MTDHTYNVRVNWTGDRGTGTSSYRAYARDHEITGEGKPTFPGSSDPHFRGDSSRYNPEDLLVASLSACHMLGYLHLCAEAGVVVVGYDDDASGTMAVAPGGFSGQFTEVVLHPHVTLAPGSDPALAEQQHEEAHHRCFIARSVNFPVRCEPVTTVQTTTEK